MKKIHIETQIKLTWEFDTDKEPVQTPTQLKENLIKEIKETLDDPDVEVKRFTVLVGGKLTEV